MFGLLAGLKATSYIVLLLFLTLYLFSTIGIILFRDNDPYHFRSVEISLLNLFNVASGDSWGDAFYTNYYGCDLYDSSGLFTNDPNQDKHVSS